MRSSQALAVATLRRVADDTGASTLDLRPRYCSAGVCATNDGDLWMFEDGIHLSVRESRALAPTFERVIRDVLRRSGSAEPVPSSSYVYPVPRS